MISKHQLILNAALVSTCFAIGCSDTMETDYGDSQASLLATAPRQIPATALNYPDNLENNRVLCQQYNGSPGSSALGAYAECMQTARQFYKEIQFQVASLTNPGTFANAFLVNIPSTTFMLPDGSYTVGLAELGAALPVLAGGTPSVVSIENKFLYKPIDSQTVFFIGDPMFAFGDATNQRMIESVQTSVYRRNGTTANCRSFTNPTGNVCWAELTEQWVYGRPLGAPTAAPTPSVARDIPSTSYPSAIEPGRVRCDQFVASAGAPDCMATAADFYKVVKRWGTVAEGTLIENVGPGTTFLLPDGRYTLGLLELLAVRPAFLGTGALRSIENRFIYKPIDPNTIILLGNPLLGVQDGARIKSVEMVQLNVYRRSGPIWVALTEQWSYAQALLGG